MNFRKAEMKDLEKIKVVFKNLIQEMYRNQIDIWDEIYPCEFFKEDIKNQILYILEEDEEIAAAFALCEEHTGVSAVTWEQAGAKAMYMDRLGVSVDFLRRGIGSEMMMHGIETAKKNGADYLRLFVVDVNEPAIKLYEKNKFMRVPGVYDEVIDEELTLHEYGYEYAM